MENNIETRFMQWSSKAWGRRVMCGIFLGYCSPPVTVYIRGPIKGYMSYSLNSLKGGSIGDDIGDDYREYSGGY